MQCGTVKGWQRLLGWGGGVGEQGSRDERADGGGVGVGKGEGGVLLPGWGRRVCRKAEISVAEFTGLIQLGIAYFLAKFKREGGGTRDGGWRKGTETFEIASPNFRGRE